MTAMAVQITSQKELEAWLEDKPREWAQVIALRNALRSFPWVADPGNWENANQHSQVALTVLRTMAISSASNTDIGIKSARRTASAIYEYIMPNIVRSRLAAAAASSTHAAAYAHAYPSPAAGDATPSTAASVATINLEIVAKSAGAEAAAADAVWQTTSSECRALESGAHPDTLQRLYLWSDAPEWWRDSWDRARKWLSSSGEGFEIWREWYYGRLEGLPHAFADFDDAADEAFYRAIIEYDDLWWKRAPAEVNADIKALVDGLRKAKPVDLPKVDYYISYAEGDDVLLNEALIVLDNLGKSYVFADRDGSGSHQIKATDQADRMIALYSERYAQSQQCEAEWLDFYYHDLDTAEQRMIAFRFDRSDLRPLMHGLSNCDLARLPPARRKPAMTKWIGWKPQPHTRTNVDQVLTTRLDPAVVANDNAMLDTERDAALNEAQIPSELANAMDELRMMLNLARLNERNLSSMMQSALKLYDEHFTERGKESSWGGLDRYMTVVAEGTDELSAETMREEKAALEQLIGSHGKCMAALTSFDEHMRELANVPVENIDQAAVDSLIDKLKSLRDEAQAQAASTDRYDSQATILVDQGRDFAFAAGAPDAGSKPNTALKRFIRYVGGFAIGTLTVLGSMASIRPTPEFKRVIEAADNLVEEFYRMIGL